MALAVVAEQRTDAATGTVSLVDMIYVCDTMNHRILKVDLTNIIMPVSLVVGSGVRGFSVDGTAPENCQLNAPMGVALNPITGHVTFVDSSDRVREITDDHVVRTIAGGGSLNDVSGSSATDVSLAGLTSLLFADDGLYVCATAQNRIVFIQ